MKAIMWRTGLGRVPVLCTVILLAASLLGCNADPMGTTEIDVLTGAEAAEAYRTSMKTGTLVSDEAAVYGDLTGDGEVDVVDLHCMSLTGNAVMGSKPMPACLTFESAADLNCDGKINVVDYQVLILKVSVGGPLNGAIDADQNGVHDSCEAAPEETTEEFVYGDLTGDGKINVVDLQCFHLTIQAVVSGAEMPFCLTNEQTADLNCDGKINVVDYQLIIQKAVSGGPLNPVIDADQNGVHDTCEAPANSFQAPNASAYGDLTGDGKIDVVDFQCFELTIQAVLGNTEMPACLTSEQAADLNCDGKINVVDYQLIIKIVMSGGPLHPTIDADQNGVHDMCEAAPEEVVEDDLLYADVNGDDAINVIDVQCVRLTIISELQGAEELPQCLATDQAADLNCDGSNNVVDYQLIIQKAMSDGPLHPVIDADQDGIHDNCQ